MGENNKQQRDYGLSCLTRRDADTNVWISHCLNYDLMEVGETPDEAWDNLKTVLKHHIEHCYSRYPQGLSRSAPSDQWQDFYMSLKRNPQRVKVEKLDIDPLPPLPEYEIPIWVQGVESSGNIPIV